MALGCSSGALEGACEYSIYHSPKLWYVRVTVIEAQDLIPSDKTKFLGFHVKVQLGNQLWKTKPIVPTGTINPHWNQELIFVAEEPFEGHFILTVVDRLGPDEEEILGSVTIPLNIIDKRLDLRMVKPQWFKLQNPAVAAGEEASKKKEVKFATKFI